jgi:hypothetical protein
VYTKPVEITGIVVISTVGEVAKAAGVTPDAPRE